MRTLRLLAAAREALDDHALAARTTANVAASTSDGLSEALDAIKGAASAWRIAGLAVALYFVWELSSNIVDQLGRP